jgi:CDP-paratose 2-epimerase
MSLAELSAWCGQRFGPMDVGADEKPRPFDVPWMILDTALAERVWGWKPERSLGSILAEIARHAMDNPRWLELVGA